MSDMVELDLALRKLRHLYEQMLQDGVKDQGSAARGLLGPAIVNIERYQAALIHEIPE